MDKVFAWDKDREGTENINKSGDDDHFEAINFPPKHPYKYIQEFSHKG